MSHILAPNKEMLAPLLKSCLRAHRFCLCAYLVLRGAYAGLRAPQFCLRHTLTRGPLLNMNTTVLERGSVVETDSVLAAKWSKDAKKNVKWPCFLSRAIRSRGLDGLTPEVWTPASMTMPRPTSTSARARITWTYRSA